MKALTVLAIFAAFITVYYAVPYTHELAHAAVCEASGYKSQLHIAFTGEARAVSCLGQPDNADLYHAAGGLAGLTLSAVIAFGIRKSRIAFIAAFPFVPQQALILGMETFAYQWYIDDNNSIPATVASLLTLVLFFILLLTYSINGKKRGSKASQDDEQRREGQ